jgi:glycosyltransferase involved in cell wall biosynthesis
MLKYTQMKIAFDLTQIPCNKTGIGIYAVNLVREILRLDYPAQGFSFYFFAQDDDGQWPQLIENTGNCRLLTINSRVYRKLPLRFLFEQILFPRRCKKLNIDAIVSFHYTMPYLTRIERTVIIPDMTFYLFPSMHRKIKRLYFKTLIPLSLARSHKIIAISQSTKNDLLQRFHKINPGKISVIHLGVDRPARGSKDREAGILASYGLEEKSYFLYVGTLEPRKNIDGIIEAYNRVMAARGPDRKKYKLVIAGMKGWFYEKIFAAVQKHRLEESVIFTGYVDEPAKQALLAHAYLFVYPSFYEGFGLPILEAMAWGVPVITGSASSLPEVAGGAGLLVDPHHWEEIADAMEKLLSDHRLYRDLSARSQERARAFSWRNTAQKTLEQLKT